MRVGTGKEECVVVATSAATHHARHFFPANRIHKYVYVCTVRRILGRMGIEGDAGGDDGDYTAKAAQVARMARTATSVVETSAAVVAMATAAKTAEWARRPTPGPFWTSRETQATLARL
jgi:hypothetical protein